MSTNSAETLRGRRLDAALTVKDLQKSLAWYCDVVGFTVDRKHEREGKLIAVSLQAGDVRILINQDDGAKGLDRVKGEDSRCRSRRTRTSTTSPKGSKRAAALWIPSQST